LFARVAGVVALRHCSSDRSHRRTMSVSRQFARAVQGEHNRGNIRGNNMQALVRAELNIEDDDGLANDNAAGDGLRREVAEDAAVRRILDADVAADAAARQQLADAAAAAAAAAGAAGAALVPVPPMNDKLKPRPVSVRSTPNAEAMRKLIYFEPHDNDKCMPRCYLGTCNGANVASI